MIHPLDPHFAAVLENLEQLSDGDLAAVSSDVCGQRWVVSFTHDRAPGITYYYNHSTGESRMLFRPYPHLDPDFLAPMTPVTIPARDGLDLPSYLTLPVGTVGGVLGTAGQAAAVKEINFATCQFSDKYLTFTVEQKTLGGRPNYYGATTCATTARGRSGSTTSIRGTGTSPRENARSHSSPFTESSHVRARRQQAGGPSHTFRLSRVAASTTTRGRHASPLFLSCHSWSSAGEHV
ncbi:hypothetical protein ACFV2X_51370 [Streptomyces sp. NPDC059679]|uniref:hypothetical protein n=1 Tax=Streptomyces sp. NPDC059679 TaxID=3346903 RepID=UPI00369C9480